MSIWCPRSIGLSGVSSSMTRLLVPGAKVLVDPLVQRRDRGAEHLHPRKCTQVRRVVLPAQRGEHPLERAIDPGDAERPPFEAQIEEVVRRGPRPHDDHVLAGELGRVAQRRRVILGQRREGSLDLRNNGPIVTARGGDEESGVAGVPIGTDHPSTVGRTSRVHPRTQADRGCELETLHPLANVGKDTGLVLARDRQITQRPVLLADLEILPGGKIAPKPADGIALLQQDGVEAGVLRVFEADDAADSAPNDDQVVLSIRSMRAHEIPLPSRQQLIGRNLLFT